MSGFVVMIEDLRPTHVDSGTVTYCDTKECIDTLFVFKLLLFIFSIMFNYLSYSKY
jgi:hypothetical protein